MPENDNNGVMTAAMEIAGIESIPNVESNPTTVKCTGTCEGGCGCHEDIQH